MYKLTGKIQHYAWGGMDFIPQLLNIKNESRQPFAEYWLGTHPNGAAEVLRLGKPPIALDKFIIENTNKVLGNAVAEQFGGLPYLLKVLDVRKMLSIQVHPTKAEAEKGFNKENMAGIPLQASHRNYKDRNHKPEIMVALSEFWLLHGFKKKELLEAVLRETQGLETLLPGFQKEGHYGLYKRIMELPQSEVDGILQPILKRERPLYKANQLSKSNPLYWACKSAETGNPELKNLDRGIFSIFFFNIVHLDPGQAIFQGAGVPHAYLEGQNIELMANSDNVLRGGLTPKHVDVSELLKHTSFEGITPVILTGEKRGAETLYPCPVKDFQLSRINLQNKETYNHLAFSAEILLVTAGAVRISGSGHTFSLTKGEAVFLGAGEDYALHSETKAELFKAAVPGF